MLFQSLDIFHNPSVETFKKHLAAATIWKALVYILLANLLLLILIYLNPNVSKSVQMRMVVILPLITLLYITFQTYMTHRAVFTASKKSSLSKLFYGYSLIYVPIFFTGLIVSILFQWVKYESPAYFKIGAVFFFMAGFIGALYIQKNWKATNETLIQSIFNSDLQELSKIQGEANSLYGLVKIVGIFFVLLIAGGVWLQFFLQESKPNPFALDDIPSDPSVSQTIQNK